MKIPKLGTFPIGYQTLFRIKLFGFVLELQREVFVEVFNIKPRKGVPDSFWGKSEGDVAVDLLKKIQQEIKPVPHDYIGQIEEAAK